MFVLRSSVLKRGEYGVGVGHAYVYSVDVVVIAD